MDADVKIALISQEFPPFTIGGISAICYDLAYSLSKRRISTTVFCGKSNKMSIEKLNKYLKVIRLPLLDLPPRHIWFQLQNFNSLLKLLKDYTILHGVDTKSSTIFAYFAKKMRKPFVTHLQGCPYSEMKAFLNSPISYRAMGDYIYYVVESPMNSFLTRLSLTQSERIVSCSYTTLNEAKRKYPHLDYTKASVIYNGINFDKFNSGSSNPEEERCSVMFYGRLFYIKGIIHLIKAIAVVKQKFPNVELEIYGKGPLEPKIRSFIQKLKLANNVFIHGYIPQRELIDKIRSSSVVVLPSFYEAQSMSVLEAMTCGKAVVAFDLPFSREFIRNFGNGLLAKAGDVEDLADKISVLLSNKKLRRALGQNAHKYVKKNHNWEILVEEYIEMYNKMICD